uniref:Coilin tudor domain-containing protein n=1 Tax=Aegilops tauschii subsp. strangulata TaxID=200361 RepID=A0A452ZIB7_AEGTS
QEGDLIAYRLVTLSSSWCPEISSYRVGKVLVYDLISSRIILLPVPEHPIITEEITCEDESDTMMVDTSPYKEDGSLEIEYPNLLDVRLVKGSEPVSADLSTPIRETGKEGKSPVGEPVALDENKGKVHSQNGTSVPALDKNKGKVHSQNGTSVPDGSKGPEAPPCPEAPPGIDRYS